MADVAAISHVPAVRASDSREGSVASGRVRPGVAALAVCPVGDPFLDGPDIESPVAVVTESTDVTTVERAADGYCSERRRYDDERQDREPLTRLEDLRPPDLAVLCAAVPFLAVVPLATCRRGRRAVEVDLPAAGRPGCRPGAVVAP